MDMGACKACGNIPYPSKRGMTAESFSLRLFHLNGPVTHFSQDPFQFEDLFGMSGR